ncbi:hypothetical protein PHLCEN_2v2638 [Hermanssonia centrifuga]|uniref:Uncharacterized protein n=1 Tax=Hermanssonia centrifuga TaxID=98765 RepID=A0A2R6RIM5_9APHY|nr:hypothetical protein PHLCEN_2v2638 [Hermanssonia centrifuga]
MPSLSGKAKKAYTAAYTKAEYKKYIDKDGSIHGCVPDLISLEDSMLMTYTHLPSHDVESIFWTLTVLLLRARPLHADEERELPFITRKAWHILENHHIDSSPRGNVWHSGDGREFILHWNPDQWTAAFHPALSSLAPLLYKMAQQVRPEYCLFTYRPRPEHLHEAMRRLLLEQLVNMKDDILLDTDSRHDSDRKHSDDSSDTIQTAGRASKRSKTHQ